MFPWMRWCRPKNSFGNAMKKILQFEGGYVNDPDDPGGCTKFGITLSTLRHYRNDVGVDCDDVRSLTTTEAKKIYRERYYENVNIHQLPEPIQGCVMDCGINIGPANAISMMQRTLNNMGCKVKDDGIIGPNTVNAADVAWKHSDKFIEIYTQKRVEYYENLVRNNPALNKFLRGWTRRARSWE